jgi:uncharacterized membrane protein YeaQ/YmgE (transglycosylase-associated protein family)
VVDDAALYPLCTGRGGGSGLVGDLLMDVIGSILGGLLFGLLGLSATVLLGSLTGSHVAVTAWPRTG